MIVLHKPFFTSGVGIVAAMLVGLGVHALTHNTFIAMLTVVLITRIAKDCGF